MAKLFTPCDEFGPKIRSLIGGNKFFFLDSLK